MATFTAIPEKTQTATAMRRVLDYVMQDMKTLYRREDGTSYKLISGQNCVPETAYAEFMATKHSYGKANGVFFKQYVQSFHPNCGATPEQIHAIGVEMAKAFEGFEVVIATHIDADHCHTHFIVNSVNCETGKKIQINEQGLEQLRHRSDEICKAHGLEVLTPYSKPKQKSLSQREYRTALRGDSRKLQLVNAIDFAVLHSRTKAQFIAYMERLGYGVKWIDHYKYITYTTPDGQRFRDNRLADDRYLKTNMEEVFAYGNIKPTVEGTKSNSRADRGSGRTSDRTVTGAVFGNAARSGAGNSGGSEEDWRIHCKKYGFDFGLADTGHAGRYDAADGGKQSATDTGNRVGGREQTPYLHGEQDRGTDYGSETDDLGRASGYDEGTESTGSVPMEDTAQMAVHRNGDWGDIAVGALALAADVQMIFGGNKENENRKRKKKLHGKQSKKQKKQKQTDHSHEDDYDLIL